MKKILLFIITASIFTFSSCFQKEQTQEKEQVIDTIPMMVMQIQNATDYIRQKPMFTKLSPTMIN